MSLMKLVTKEVEVDLIDRARQGHGNKQFFEPFTCQRILGLNGD